MQPSEAGQRAETAQIVDHAGGEGALPVRLPVMEHQGGISVFVPVIPVLPDLEALRVDHLVPGQAQVGDPSEHGRRQGLQLVQAQEGKVRVVLFPAALGVLDPKFIEIPGLHQVLRLLAQFRRYRQKGALEAIQGLKIVDFQAHQGKSAALFIVHDVQEVQILHVRHAVQNQVPGLDGREIRQGKAAGDGQLAEGHALQSTPVREPGAVEKDQRTALAQQAALMLQSLQRTQRGAMLQGETGGSPVLRQSGQVGDTAALQAERTAGSRQLGQVQGLDPAEAQVCHLKVLQVGQGLLQSAADVQTQGRDLFHSGQARPIPDLAGIAELGQAGLILAEPAQKVQIRKLCVGQGDISQLLQPAQEGDVPKGGLARGGDRQLLQGRAASDGAVIPDGLTAVNAKPCERLQLRYGGNILQPGKIMDLQLYEPGRLLQKVQIGQGKLVVQLQDLQLGVLQTAQVQVSLQILAVVDPEPVQRGRIEGAEIDPPVVDHIHVDLPESLAVGQRTEVGDGAGGVDKIQLGDLGAPHPFQIRDLAVHQHEIFQPWQQSQIRQLPGLHMGQGQAAQVGHPLQKAQIPVRGHAVFVPVLPAEPVVPVIIIIPIGKGVPFREGNVIFRLGFGIELHLFAHDDHVPNLGQVLLCPALGDIVLRLSRFGHDRRRLLRRLPGPPE